MLGLASKLVGMMVILLDLFIKVLSGTSGWKRDHWPLSKQYAYEGDLFSLYHSRENSPEMNPTLRRTCWTFSLRCFYSFEVFLMGFSLLILLSH